jgi:hypothetical protein
MPIKIPDNLPAKKILTKEHIFVLDEQMAIRQDIRPLRILILNLMPTKIVTETQLHYQSFQYPNSRIFPYAAGSIFCSHENDNLYLFDYRSYISDEIGKVFDIDFTKKRLLLKDIKKVLATAKK